jgi:hypothetical protein
MDFLFNLPDTNYRNQVFYASGVWRKPSNITMVQFFLVGAGGGGGAGYIVSTTQGAGSGAGGGGGAITKLLIPSVFLPDELYVNVGIGGSAGVISAAGVSGGNGVSGTATYVDLINGNNTSSTLIATANGGTRGTGGTVGGVSGTGGAGGVASTISSSVYLGLGYGSFYAGGAGQSGTATGTLSPVTTSTNLTSGGAGGSGRNSTVNRGTPGSIGGNNVYLPSLSISDSGTTYNGQNGIFSLNPFQSYGGVGGWGAQRLVGQACGGNGGNGIMGSGGGGGGGGNSGCVTTGNGGRGGDGLVIITCF